MDHLWSPWRLQYVLSNKVETGCPFCEAPTLPEQQSLIVFSGRTCYVILNLYPYNNGHLMVVPYKHTDTLTGLDADELHELADLTRLSEAALREGYRLEGINMGVNLGKVAGAGIVEHIHVHLVPRWLGDTNFMPVIGQTRVLPEELGATAAKLRPIFQKLVAGSL